MKQDVDIDRQRPAIIGNAEPIPGSALVGGCDRCGGEVWGSIYQRRKVDEILATYEPLPVVEGGRRLPRIALLCWKCSTDLGIKMTRVQSPAGDVGYLPRT